ncbi:MAG: hypothetical protein KL863_15225 [Rhizobium sp.]|nr:hypothetical protein [Rhizobium sp.]
MRQLKLLISISKTLIVTVLRQVTQMCTRTVWAAAASIGVPAPRSWHEDRRSACPMSCPAKRRCPPLEATGKGYGV